MIKGYTYGNHTEVDMSRGGAREGAGRPVGSTTGRKASNPTLSMRFPRFELEQIDRLAERLGITRTEWLLRLVRERLQETRPR